jgi:hypothetical protein
VEFTNNEAERSIRPLKVQMPISAAIRQPERQGRSSKPRRRDTAPGTPVEELADARVIAMMPV